MDLHSLLVEHKSAILEKCRLKVAEVVDQSASSKTWDVGLPMLYAELVEVLRVSGESDSAESRQKFVYETVRASASRAHAQEAFSHGFTVSQLVHGYGCICQGITEYAAEVNAPITAAEIWTAQSVSRCRHRPSRYGIRGAAVRKCRPRGLAAIGISRP